jgi:hypothetical protein
MNTNPPRPVSAPSLPSGEYVLRTSRPGLMDVAARLLGAGPLVASLIDVPAEGDVAGWDGLLEDTGGVVDGSSEEDWAALAVPLVNAMRVRAAAGSGSAFPGCKAFLMRCPPAVSWFALRNSMGRESENRPSGPCDGMPLILALMRRDSSWLQVFVRIRESAAFSA